MEANPYEICKSICLPACPAYKQAIGLPINQNRCAIFYVNSSTVDNWDLGGSFRAKLLRENPVNVFTDSPNIIGGYINALNSN